MHIFGSLKLYVLTIFLIYSHTTIAQTGLPGHRHIAVKGSAEVTAIADIAVVHLDVESTKVLGLSAKRAVDDRVNDLIGGLGAFGIDEKDLSASDISIRPRYENPSHKMRKVSGYRAHRTLKVTLKDIRKLSALLDFILRVKINGIRNIELKSSDAAAHEAQAHAQAINNATLQAAALAKAFGAKLGPIYSIHPVAKNMYSRYGRNKTVDGVQFEAMGALKSSQPGQYLQENLVFSASINSVYDLIIDF